MVYSMFLKKIIWNVTLKFLLWLFEWFYVIVKQFLINIDSDIFACLWLILQNDYEYSMIKLCWYLFVEKCSLQQDFVVRTLECRHWWTVQKIETAKRFSHTSSYLIILPYCSLRTSYSWAVQCINVKNCRFITTCKTHGRVTTKTAKSISSFRGPWM